MADTQVKNMTENTAPLGSDIEYMVDDPNGTPADHKIYKGSNNLLPDGFILNGAISVTVASNNITVALKTKSGGNPSATDPVSVWINGSYRRCTAALSVTKNAGTNWFGSGGATLATLEQDYFVYLGWNTTPATDIVDIGFARVPFGRVYSDFSSTTTADTYLAFGNASTPTSTDNWVNVGRFAATLSATASFNWSVPTFTNLNKRDVPTYHTRWLTWAPTLTGFSANPSTTSYKYMIRDNDVIIQSSQGVNGTSNATTFTMTAPMTSVTSTGAFWAAPGYAPVDNGTLQTTPAFASIASASTTINVYKNADGGTTAWTNANGKRVAYFQLQYPIKL